MSYGAGAGETWSRDPLAGCDRVAGHGRVLAGPYARLRGQIPEGPSSALRRAPFYGDATKANEAGRRYVAENIRHGVSEAAK
jgi:hypothetical protein